MHGCSRLAAASASRRKRFRCASVAQWPSPMTLARRCGSDSSAARDTPHLDRHDRFPPAIRNRQSQSAALLSCCFLLCYAHCLTRFDIRSRGPRPAATDARVSRSRPASNRQAVQRPSGASAKISAPHFRQTLSALLIMGESLVRSPSCTARNSVIRYVRNTVIK